MKDSRTGAYGAIGIILLLSLKIFTLGELMKIDIQYCIKSIILAHVLSRFSAVTMIYTHEYAREDASSKIKPIAKKITSLNLIISCIWLICALVLFQNIWIFLVILPVYLMKVYLAHYFTKWIGGYTGDCLGATQQINEVLTLLFCLGLWKYI
jgi:adenosylcobinamide-GDP ribazoletransferase